MRNVLSFVGHLMNMMIVMQKDSVDLLPLNLHMVVDLMMKEDLLRVLSIVLIILPLQDPKVATSSSKPQLTRLWKNPDKLYLLPRTFLSFPRCSMSDDRVIGVSKLKTWRFSVRHTKLDQ